MNWLLGGLVGLYYSAIMAGVVILCVVILIFADLGRNWLNEKRGKQNYLPDKDE